MGQEDESILQKIKVYRIDGKPHTRSYRGEKTVEFGEYDDGLTQRLRLKTVDRSSLGMTYAKAKTLVATKGLKSKQEYSVSCLQDIRLPLDPESSFHGHFTNWVDYLSVERIYYDLETCKQKVAEYMSQYPELTQQHLNLIEMSRVLRTLDPLFPPHDIWVDYYQTELDKILNITFEADEDVYI
jgi:hypothetical protein